MNHLVPNFGMKNDFAIPSSTTVGGGGGGRVADGGLRKSTMADDDIMELLWQNGQVVVMQTQNQRNTNNKKSLPPFKTPIGDANSAAAPATTAMEVEEQDVSNANHLFMQEDEMASWLHYPSLDDNSFEQDFCSDFLYTPPPPPPPPLPTLPTATVTAAVNAASTAGARSTAVAGQKLAQTTVARPSVPVPPADVDRSRFTNFKHFSMMKPARAESGPPVSHKGEQTVVDSSTTPAAMERRDPRVSQLLTSTGEMGNITGRSMSGAAMASTSSAGRDMNTCDVTVTSSPGGSAASISASAEPATKRKSQAVDRKRKAARQADETECYSEDVEFEPAAAKKQARGSTSTKRSRAAEVHNLSERRRRDRINEKMKALQELIPRCNKADKASMLDEAIEYLKSLQMQVQMMSMGGSMVPMMFPGGQHYMSPMGMGMGMGMGLGMDMSMSRPMVPYPSVFAGSPMPNPSTSSHPGGPRFPMPAYHMQPVPPPDISRLQTTHQSDPTLNPLASQSPSQPRLPNLPDPYQRYLGFQQMQMSILQNQAMAQPSTTKPSATTGADNSGHH